MAVVCLICFLGLGVFTLPKIDCERKRYDCVTLLYNLELTMLFAVQQDQHRDESSVVKQSGLLPSICFRGQNLPVKLFPIASYHNSVFSLLGVLCLFSFTHLMLAQIVDGDDHSKHL